MKRLRWVGLLLPLAALLWVALQLRPYSETVILGAQDEALRNPYLAAERFLQGQGRAVQSLGGPLRLDELPAQGQALLLLGDRSRMTARQADQLLAWADQGGHLLFVAEQLYDPQRQASGDLLLDRLGVRQYLTQDLSRLPEDDEPFPRLTKLYLENEDAPAYIGFDPSFHLEDTQQLAHAWANSAQATHMLQMRQGEGLITVLSDAWIWQNAHLGEYDNAWLLWYLTQDRAVLLLRDSDAPSLASLLWRHFPEALLTFTVLLVLLAWRLTRRHGPLLPAAATQGLSRREQLRAHAAWHRRQEGASALLARLQKDIEQRAARRHLGFAQLPVAERWRLLGQRCGLPIERISRAMRPHPPGPLPGPEMVRHIQELQIIRNAL